MFFNDRQANRQAQARAAARALRRKKWIKYLGQIFPRNSGTVVRENKNNLPIIVTHGNMDRAAIFRRRDGLLRILDEIDKNLLQKPCVDLDHGQLRRIRELDRNIFLPQRFSLLIHNLLDDFLWVYFLAGERGRP